MNVFAIEHGRRKNEAAPVKHFGSLYLLAVAHLATTDTDARGLLYLSPTGDMLLAASDHEAPADARYVGKIGPDVDPTFIAARLKYVASL